ncbi:MAG: hypothetical protein AB7H43_13670 [Acidimicrobiia bacterium]
MSSLHQRIALLAATVTAALATLLATAPVASATALMPAQLTPAQLAPAQSNRFAPVAAEFIQPNSPIYRCEHLSSGYCPLLGKAQPGIDRIAVYCFNPIPAGIPDNKPFHYYATINYHDPARQVFGSVPVWAVKLLDGPVERCRPYS